MEKYPKNRPMWRIRLANGRERGCDAVFLGYRSRFGDGHPGRRQCIATARSTGKRCKNDCIQGATCCRVHGGHRIGYRAAIKRLGPGVISLASGRNAPRKALAKLSTIEPYPLGAPWLLSPVERGKTIEAGLNRVMAPGEWVKITKPR